MVKLKWVLVFSMLVFVLPVSSLAADSTFGIFAGTKNGYDWPKLFRFQIYSVEFGMYPNAFGIQKRIAKDWYYGALGVAVIARGTNDVGTVASVGAEKIWGWFGLRADVSVATGLRSTMGTEATIGASLHF